jgi:hypothetical protein
LPGAFATLTSSRRVWDWVRIWRRLQASMNDILTAVKIAFVQSWHAAVYNWLNSRASEGWAGGDHNLLMMISELEILGLTDACDKQAALTMAFEALKAEYGLQPPIQHLN